MSRPREFPDRMELRLPDGWRDQLTAMASRNGRPIAAEAREAIGRYIGADDDDGPPADDIATASF